MYIYIYIYIHIYIIRGSNYCYNGNHITIYKYVKLMYCAP